MLETIRIRDLPSLAHREMASGVPQACACWAGILWSKRIVLTGFRW
jgi:hypothetical protein